MGEESGVGDVADRYGCRPELVELQCTEHGAEIQVGLWNATLEYTFPLLPPNENVGNDIRELRRRRSVSSLPECKYWNLTYWY